MNHRRNWLKQTGLGIVGLGIIPLEGFAIPITENFIEEKKESLIRLKSPDVLMVHQHWQEMPCVIISMPAIAMIGSC